MHRSAPTKTNSSRNKEIVDPTAWESSEIGGAEGAVLGTHKHERKNKVSSIRSSLFKKNVTGTGMTPTSANQTTVDETARIFFSNAEAAALEAPFVFHGSNSLEFCEYGKANKKLWAKDILALVHNAVRSELKDLSIILRSIQKLNVRLCVGDFVQIREWWQTCSGIVLDYLDLEAKHLMPWYQFAADNAKKKDEACEQFFKEIVGRQRDLRGLTMSIAKSFGDICDPPVINLAKLKQETSTAIKAMLLVNSMDALISQLSEYMWEQEKRLPTTLTSVYKSEKKEREIIMSRVVKHVTKSARKKEHLLVLFTRWMIDSKSVKGFLKVLQELHDCNYSDLQTQFEVNHAGFIHQFSVKAEM